MKKRDAHVTVRMPEEMRRQLKARADADERSLASLIVKVLQEYLDGKPAAKRIKAAGS